MPLKAKACSTGVGMCQVGTNYSIGAILDTNSVPFWAFFPVFRDAYLDLLFVNSKIYNIECNV